MSNLIATGDNGKDITIQIEEKIEIGRGSETWSVIVRTPESVIDLNVEDATVSQKHACVYWQKGKLILMDLGSTNGTYINGKAILGWKPGHQSDPVELRGQSLIRFGYNTSVRVDRGVPSLNKQEWKQLTSAMPKKDVSKITNAFRIVLDISNDCCNTLTTVKGALGRLDDLNLYLESDKHKTAVDDFRRKLKAETYEGELMSEDHMHDLKNLCIRLSELWCAKI